jgi:SAM-dependent methyltransferase
MQWLAKSFIQSCVDRLPVRISRPLYYQMQRRFGNLRRSRIVPTSRLLFGMDICRQIRAHGRSPRGADFMEVGTGWRLNMPIAFWLCGARSTLTLDLNPYLRFALIKEDLQYLREHGDELLSRLQGEYGDLLDVARWHQLLDHRPTSLNAFLALCGITYQSPADARHTGRPSQTIDFHVSCNVFEHIPRNDLQEILEEANRVVKPNGLLLHRVDHTDHFSHADATLSPVHFLQYSDEEWKQYGRSRYAYVNRLREDDYASLFTECDQEVRATNSQSDTTVEAAIRRGFSVDTRFCDKTPEILSRLTSLFVVTPQSASRALVEAA